MTTLAPVPPLVAGDGGWPVIGRVLDYVADPVRLMRHQWETYGPVSPFNGIGETAVMLLGPDACEVALRNADKAFLNGPAWSELVGPFFDRGLMLLDLGEHHTHRRIMQQAFTRDRLVGYTDAMHAPIAEGLARWVPRVGTPTTVRVYPALKQLTLDVAADIFMGGAEDTSPAQMDRVNAAFVACVQAAAGWVRADVPFTRWGRAYRGRRVLEDFLRHYLPRRRAHPGEDLLSALCGVSSEEGERFTDDDVVNHMVFLMMAAHDTSTITLTTILQHLGQHPEWQERCREEGRELGDRPTYDELAGLVSLDLVVREALRLRAPVPVLARRTRIETEVLGHRIPADTGVVVGVQLSHLLEEYWTDPQRFDPERFAEPRREDRGHRYAWEPFGGGVHKCIGLAFGTTEVKAVVHHLLRDFTWSLDPAYEPPMNHHSLPFPTDGQPVVLTRTR